VLVLCLPNHLLGGAAIEVMSDEPKHVVLVVLDSLRPDHMSCYGYHRNTTPFLLSILRTQGLIFEHAFSAASWTLPAVTSILTGVLPSIHQRYSPFQRNWAREVKPISTILAHQGFHCEMISANTLFVNQKFGFAEGFHDTHVVRSFLDLSKIRKLARAFRSGFGKTLHQGGPDVLDQFKESFRSHDRDASFFYLHFNDTHSGYSVPRDVIDEVNDEAQNLIDLLRIGSDRRKRANGIARYDGAILFSDRLLQNLIEFLQDIHLWNDTLLILTSDHGEAFGEYEGFWGHGEHLFLPLLHVPLILLGGRIFPEAKRIHSLAHTIDIVPSVLDLLDIDCHLDFDPRVRGISQFRQDKVVSDSPRRIFSEHWQASLDGGPGIWQRSGIDGKYQMIQVSNNRPTLYEMANYSYNPRDLSCQVPEIEAGQLFSDLAYISSEEYKLTTEEVADPVIVKRLQDLGYLE
jgi:arylsulfatase A-like enzyme